MSDENELPIFCTNNHELKHVNQGFGNKHKKTRCVECKGFGKNDFLSCKSCGYDLCKKCQDVVLSTRVAHQKENPQCLHDKKELYENIKEKIEKGGCDSGCTDRESSQYFACLCGYKLCLGCYTDLFPDEKSKYIVEPKKSEGDCHYSNVENLIFTEGELNSGSCIGGCSSESKDGYMTCKLCTEKLCFKCFYDIFPNEDGKYPPKAKEQDQTEIIVEVEVETKTEVNVEPEPVRDSEKRAEVKVEKQVQVSKETPSKTSNEARVDVNVDIKAENNTKTAVTPIKIEESNNTDSNNNKSNSNKNGHITEPCDTDRSETCFKKDPLRCPKNHLLIELNNQDHNKKICDECKLKDLNHYYYCNEDSFTRCPACARGEAPASDQCCLVF